MLNVLGSSNSIDLGSALIAAGRADLEPKEN